MSCNILIVVLPETGYFRATTKPVGSIALNFVVAMGLPSSLDLTPVNPKVG